MKKALVLFFLVNISLYFQSCSEVYNTEEGISGIILRVDSSSKIVGEEIILNVKTEGSEILDVTEEAEIFVNGELLSSSSFTTTEVGIYNISARYDNLESEPLEVEFTEEPEINFKKRVLVEDYTGTWCGWCPRVSYGMKLLSEQSDAAVFVAIHRAPSGTADPFTYDDADDLELLINQPGYPKGFLNRLTQWSFPEPDNLGQAIAFTQGANPKVGIKMISNIENNQIDLTVSALFAKDFENLKLVVYLLENGLVYPQVNYTSYYEGENPIEDYVHNYTLRQTLTDIVGDELNNQDTRDESEFTRTFNLNLPDNVTDVNEIDFVAFLTDAEGHVINARKSALGETQDYEILD